MARPWDPLPTSPGGGTSAPSPLSLPYTAIHDADEPDGIFSAMARQGGAFINPAFIPFRKAVDPTLVGCYGYTATQASNQDTYRLAYRATDGSLAENGDVVQGGESHTTAAASRWWKADFGANDVVLTKFAMAGRDGASGLYPRNWKVQGSNDDVAWTDLATVVGAGPSSGTWYSVTITDATAWRYVRVLQTGNNSGGTTHLVIGAVEMWGTLDVA